MPNLRQATIPFDHLLAELAAFPLASVDALEIGCTTLDPSLEGLCGDLWRRAERRLVASFPNTSLDEMFGVRDRLWFDKPSKFPRPLYDYLWLLAYHALEAHGSSAVPRPMFRPMPSENSRHDRAVLGRECWRWLSFALPPDLLLAGLSCSESFPSSVTTLPPRLERVLADQGFAESHQHFGAGLEFQQLWVAAVRRAAANDFKMASLESPGAELDDGRGLAPWLLRAALLRVMLAAYLNSGPRFEVRRGTTARQAAANDEPSGGTGGPEAHASTQPWTLTRFIASGLRRVERLAGPVGASVLCRAVAEVNRGRITSGPREHAELRSLYRRWGALSVASVDRVDHVQWADPMARFFPPRSRGQITCEMQFITAALHHMSGRGREDALFAHLFWQTQRVRNLIYRHVVQRPMTPGLLWFVRTYDRLSPLRKGFGAQRHTMMLSLRAAAGLAGAGHGLRAFEARTAPSDSSAEALRLLRDAARLRHELDDAAPACPSSAHAPDPKLRQPQAPEPCEFGLVLHVIRSRGGNLDQGRVIAHVQRGHADPATLRPMGKSGLRDLSREAGAGFRFARWYRHRRREVVCLASLLLEFPRAIEVVRGFDVCTDELGVPIWVVAPFFRYLRQAGDLAAAFLHDALGCEVPSPRATAHAGEDFVHLLGGLRRVDESLRYLRLRAGDRLGHGLALGVDARQWAEAHGPLAVYKEERLLDLTWEWGLYAERRVAPPRGRALLLEHEIARLSAEIFGRVRKPYEMHRFAADLHSERTLRALGFPDRARHCAGAQPEWSPSSPHPSGLAAPLGERLGLVNAYLRDVTLFDRGHSTEWIDPHDEGEALARVQSHLRARLGSVGVTVEVNPSSNLLVGNLGDFDRHPLWRLNPPPGLGPAKAEPPVAICVGSDDPLTFATQLPAEFARLYDALMLAGGKDEEVMHWLDRVRRAGIETRFTLPRVRGGAKARRAGSAARHWCEDEMRLTGVRGLRLHERIKPLP